VALWSMFVEVGAERYSTQFTASDPRGAITELLASSGFLEMASKIRNGAGRPLQFTAADILYIVPMEGLTNMHLCQLGREGKYASVVMARTESEPYV
jgi:hypothetical protein